MIKVQLIYAASSITHKGEEYLGINRIYAHLQSKNINCVLTDLLYDIDINTQYEKIDMSCNYFGFSIFGDSAEFIFKYSEYIKSKIPDAIIFYGGIFASNCYDLIFNDCDSVDFIVLGHGEKPIEDFFALRTSNVAVDEIVSKHINLVSRKYNQDKELCNLDINTLCLPSREILKSRKRNLIIVDLITKHGCAGSCSFCSVRGKGSYRNAENIFNEIIEIYKETDMRCFNFSDSSFEDFGTIGKKTINDLCDLIFKCGIKFSFRCLFRAESFTNTKEDIDLLLKMKSAGFYSFFIGIEAANDDDLKVFNKRATKEHCYNVLNLFYEIGLDPKYGFIMINPYSTKITIQENFEFLQHFKCPELKAYINCLEIYCNSNIHKRLIQENLLSDSYSYISNLFGYYIKDDYARSAFEFIKNRFSSSEVANVTSLEYRTFDYMLSYIHPLLGGEADYFVEQRKIMDEKLFAAHNEYFADIFINHDLISAEKNYEDYTNIVNEIYNSSTTLTHGAIRKYLKYKKGI